MDYCRFSSDNYKCDLYVYRNAEGVWVVHVKTHRFVGRIPTLPDKDEVGLDKYMAAFRKRAAWIRKAKQKAITLPHAGDTFQGTLHETLETVEALVTLGYKVPDDVIPRIKEDLNGMLG